MGMADRDLDRERMELVRLTAVSAATDAGRAARRLARRSLLLPVLALVVAVGARWFGEQTRK